MLVHRISEYFPVRVKSNGEKKDNLCLHLLFLRSKEMSAKSIEGDTLQTVQDKIQRFLREEFVC